MILTESPLFEDALASARRLTAQYLVPNKDLAEWWRECAKGADRDHYGEYSYQAVSCEREGRRVPDPRRYYPFNLPGSDGCYEGPKIAVARAKEAYEAAIFAETVDIAGINYLSPEQALLVLDALDCRDTLLNPTDPDDSWVRYRGGGETIEVRVKRQMVRLLYPQGLELRRNQGVVTLTVPAHINPKKPPPNLWREIAAFRDGERDYDIIPLKDEGGPNESRPAYDWRIYELRGTPKPETDYHRIVVSCGRHRTDWYRAFGDEGDQFPAALRALLSLDPHGPA